MLEYSEEMVYLRVLLFLDDSVGGGYPGSWCGPKEISSMGLGIKRLECLI